MPVISRKYKTEHKLVIDRLQLRMVTLTSKIKEQYTRSDHEKSSLTHLLFR